MIYAIGSADTSTVKIGVAKNPSTRVKELQTGNPYRLALYGLFRGDSSYDDYVIEEKLHTHFESIGVPRLTGEWFQCVPENLTLLPMPTGIKYEPKPIKSTYQSKSIIDLFLEEKAHLHLIDLELTRRSLEKERLLKEHSSYFERFSKFNTQESDDDFLSCL
jgi:hypothetical protein